MFSSQLDTQTIYFLLCPCVRNSFLEADQKIQRAETKKRGPRDVLEPTTVIYKIKQLNS